MSLPRPDNWNKDDKFAKYNFGYSAYMTPLKDNKVSIYSPKLDFKGTLIIDSNIAGAITYFKEFPYTRPNYKSSTLGNSN
jgi:hypothetical protein